MKSDSSVATYKNNFSCVNRKINRVTDPLIPKAFENKKCVTKEKIFFIGDCLVFIFFNCVIYFEDKKNTLAYKAS